MNGLADGDGLKIFIEVRVWLPTTEILHFF